MAGPTDILTEDVKDLRESHQRLTDEIHELRGDLAEFRTEMTGELGKLRQEMTAESGKLRQEVTIEFGKVRTEVAEQLGTINGTLQRLEERLNHSVSVAKWTIGILMPIIAGLIGTAFWLTWHAAKLDSRVERVEMRLGKEQPAAVPITRK